MSNTINPKPGRDPRKDRRKRPTEPDGTSKKSQDSIAPPIITKPGCKTNGVAKVKK